MLNFYQMSCLAKDALLEVNFGALQTDKRIAEISEKIWKDIVKTLSGSETIKWRTITILDHELRPIHPYKFRL